MTTFTGVITTAFFSMRFYIHLCVKRRTSFSQLDLCDDLSFIKYKGWLVRAKPYLDYLHAHSHSAKTVGQNGVSQMLSKEAVNAAFLTTWSM